MRERPWPWTFHLGRPLWRRSSTCRQSTPGCGGRGGGGGGGGGGGCTVRIAYIHVHIMVKTHHGKDERCIRLFFAMLSECWLVERNHCS